MNLKACFYSTDTLNDWGRTTNGTRTSHILQYLVGLVLQNAMDKFVHMSIFNVYHLPTGCQKLFQALMSFHSSDHPPISAFVLQSSLSHGPD